MLSPMRAMGLLVVTTAFRWTLAIAGGFTAMALLLFAFIYWQTAAREQERIDGLVLAVVRRIAEGPGEAVPRLATWLAEDLHGVRCGAVFGPGDNLLGGNILALPAGLPLDGRAHRAEVGPIDRDGDRPEVVRGVVERLPDGRLLALGYDIDDLDEVQEVILRALGLGTTPAVLPSLAVGTVLA